MTRSWPSSSILLLCLSLAALRPAAADLAITERMHHLRSGAAREWAEFPPLAEGAELRLWFDARPNQAEHTLRLRHRDLKQAWRVLVNGHEIARLPSDEADMVTYWKLPRGTLVAGRNEVRVHSTGTASDDVMIGEMTVIERAREQVLSEATLDVTMVEGPRGQSIPGRITLTDPNGTLMSVGTISGPHLAVRPGVVYSRGGPVRLKLRAGRYVVHAGRGFEYGVTTSEVDLAPESEASRRLSISREVDTGGWAAMDTHVHTGTFAKHGDAAVEERMLTIAGEGIELPVSAEHNLRIDLDGHARETGVRDYFTPVLGSEVTTPAMGHFNVFPIPADAVAIDQGAADWEGLRRTIARAALEPIVVLNHGRDVHGGFRPLGRARHIGIAGEDLEGRTLPANAMEVVNSGAVMTDALALPGDWMGMLNRGIVLTPIGSSDSHDVSRYILGQGRTYVRCEDGNPGRIDLARAMEGVRRGQVTVSYGLLTEIAVLGMGPGDLVRPKGDLAVRIRVKGPGWTRAQRVALYANGIPVRESEISDAGKPGMKWEATWRVPTPSHDVHLVAIASGPGITGAHWPTAKPYQPTSIEFTPYVLGVTGAVFVDADGSGAFDSALDYARREVAGIGDAQPLVRRLARYDRAVAIQAASLLRRRDPAGFEQTIRGMMEHAAPHVAQGFAEYVDAWKDRAAQQDIR